MEIDSGANMIGNAIEDIAHFIVVPLFDFNDPMLFTLWKQFVAIKVHEFDSLIYRIFGSNRFMSKINGNDSIGGFGNDPCYQKSRMFEVLFR